MQKATTTQSVSFTREMIKTFEKTFSLIKLKKIRSIPTWQLFAEIGQKMLRNYLFYFWCSEQLSLTVTQLYYLQ